MSSIISELGSFFPIWNTSRAAGLTAYIMLFLSMTAGITHSFPMVSPKMRGKLNLLHQSTGWFGLLFGLLHGLVLVYDQDVNLSLKAIFLPFTAHTDRISIGLGVLAFYIMVLLILSSDLMKNIGRKVWRAIHYLSLPGYLLALYHGISMGPDEQSVPIVIMYSFTTGVVLILFVLRILQPKNPPKTAKSTM